MKKLIIIGLFMMTTLGFSKTKENVKNNNYLKKYQKMIISGSVSHEIKRDKKDNINLNKIFESLKRILK